MLFLLYTRVNLKETQFLCMTREHNFLSSFYLNYIVVDKSSFTRAEYFLTLLQDMDLLRSRACILVGNKIDLARSRAISSQGRDKIN